MIEEHLKQLQEFRRRTNDPEPIVTPLASGGFLIRVANVRVEGWNRPSVDVLFVAPPGYPAGQPDCFWVEPAGFRIAGGGTPQATNDSNPIPGDVEAGRSTTWFSWHVQSWNPSRDTLMTYFKVILDRLKPAR